MRVLRARIATLERAERESDPSPEAHLEKELQPDRLRQTLLELQRHDLGDQESSIDLLLRRDAETLGVDRVSYWSLESDADLIENKRLYILSKGECVSDDIHHSRDRFTRLIEALTDQGEIIADHGLRDQRIAELAECHLVPLGITSLLAIPVWARGELKGILFHEVTETERAWNRAECEFAQSIAQMVALSMETSERKQAENALRQSEQGYRSFMEATPDPMIVYDTEGNVTYLNPAFTRVFGWTLEEQCGKRLDFVPEEHLAETAEAVKRLLRGETVVSLDTRRLTKDGKVLDILGSATTFRGPDGEMAGSIVTLRDITKKREIESALRESEEKFRELYQEANRTSRLHRQMLDNILNASPIAIVYYEDGRLAWLNRAMAQMFGDQVYEGRRPAEFYASEEEYKRVRSLFFQCLGEDALTETEAQFKRADGSVFTGLLRLSALNSDEPGKGNMAIIVDLSEKQRAELERRETEERYRTLVEESFDGILIHNGRNITFANSRLHEMLGYADGELVGIEYWKVFHPDERLTIQERAMERVRGEDVPSQYEVMLQRKDGTSFDVELNARSVTFEDQVGVQVWIRDISQRKRVERQLVESRKTLTNILSASPVGIAKAENRRIAWGNKAFMSMVGFDDERDYLGKSTSIIYESEEEFQRVGQVLYSKLQAGTHADTDATFRRKDGTLFDGHITVAPMDPLNPTTDVIAAISDISERKKAEKSLQQSEKTARALLKATPDGALLLDTEGTVLEANGVAARLTGVPMEQLVGRALADLLPDEVSENVRQRTEEVLQWGTPTRFVQEVAARFLDNTIYPLFDPEGNVIRLAVFARDITDQKMTEHALKESEERHKKLYEESRKSEELYRSLLNSSADAVVIYDMDGRVTYVNGSFTTIFGWTIDEVKDRRIDFVPKSEREANTELVRSVVWEGKPWSDFETKRYTKDGRTLDVSVSASRYHDHRGEPVGTMVILRDISGRKRADAELAQALEAAKLLRSEAEAASMAKSDFVANMSHEVRTPMNAIIGLTDLALRTDPSAKIKDYLTKIMASSRSLLGIINDILDFSKIEAGKLDLESVDFDLRDVIGGLTDLLGEAASGKGLELLAVVGPEVPCALTGDPLRLGQILTNLTTNALKFTEEGEIVVKASLVKKDRRRATIDFTVKDSGIGIAPEKISKLFESFTQADGSTTRKYGGSGLGLTICRRLVEMMGGQIRVESEPGEGSTFMFRLEFVRQHSVKDRRYRLQPGLEGLKVLVVDDNRMAREILLEMLRSFAFEALAVKSGEEALDELAAATNDRPYDLVLMDWKMAGMNGIETAVCIDQDQRLKKHVPKIIMVTVHGRADVMKQAEEAGLEGFLTKPVNQSLLFDTIIEVFGKKVERRGTVQRPLETDAQGSARVKGAQILLVEDNEINQQVATEILEGVGAHVQIAHNGREAIQAVAESDFDAVLMDIQMPEIDGYDATRIIREGSRNANLPIIAMTAHALKGDREKSLAAGMNDHITKPIGVDELLSVLGTWIQPRQNGAERSASESERREEASEIPLPDSLPGIKIQRAIRRFGGNTRLLRKLLGDFCKNYITVSNDIKDALTRGDIELAQRVAHTLKGVAGNIGAEDLSEAADNLESCIKHGNGEEIDRLFSRLEEDLQKVLASAAGLVAQTEPAPEPDGDADSRSRLDPTELKPLVNELDDLLQRSHFRAAEVAQSLKDKLGDTGPEDEIIRLLASLNKFDFKGARDALRSVAKSLSIGCCAFSSEEVLD